jgi:hypothetical protein
MLRSLTNRELADFHQRLCEVATARFGTHWGRASAARAHSRVRRWRNDSPSGYFKDYDDILSPRGLRKFAQAPQEAFASSGNAPLAPRDAYIHFALNNAASYKLLFDRSQKVSVSGASGSWTAAKLNAPLSSGFRVKAARWRSRTPRPYLSSPGCLCCNDSCGPASNAVFLTLVSEAFQGTRLGFPIEAGITVGCSRPIPSGGPLHSRLTASRPVRLRTVRLIVFS